MKTRLLNAGRLAQACDYVTPPPPAERAAFLAAHGAQFTAMVTSAAVGAAPSN